MTEHSGHRRVNARFPYQCGWSGEAVIPHHLVPRGDWGPCGALVYERQSVLALYARMELHLLNHAAFTRFCIKSGTDFCFRFRKTSEEMGTSQLTTGHRFLQPTPPDGLVLPHVVSFPRRASSKATPARLAAPFLGVPSHWRRNTNVVSMASRVNPSAITSILRSSKQLKAPKSKSRTKAFGVTLAPASGHTQEETPVFPKPLPQGTLTMMSVNVDLAATSAGA